MSELLANFINLQTIPHCLNGFHQLVLQVTCHHTLPLYSPGHSGQPMQINTSKTKEIILCFLISISLSPLFTSSGTVEHVVTFKLLGIHLDTNLPWSVHINSITSTASKRLYLLKQLNRAGVQQNQLLHFYRAMRCISAVFAVMQCLSVCLSVCPSVHPSVTFVDHVKTNKHIFEIFSPSVATPFQFFNPKGGADIPTGTPLTGASNARGMIK